MSKTSKSWKSNFFPKCDIISLSHLNNGKIGKSEFPGCTHTIEILFVNGICREKFFIRLSHLHHQCRRRPRRLRSQIRFRIYLRWLDHLSGCNLINNISLSGYLRLIGRYRRWTIHPLRPLLLSMHESPGNVQGRRTSSHQAYNLRQSGISNNSQLHWVFKSPCNLKD